MSISGHKTRSVFDRYNIVSQTDIGEAVAKVEAEQNRVNALAAAVRAEFGQSEHENRLTIRPLPFLDKRRTSVLRMAWMVPGGGLEPPQSFLAPADFKSAASASFAIPADARWR